MMILDQKKRKDGGAGFRAQGINGTKKKSVTVKPKAIFQNFKRMLHHKINRI